MRILKQYAVVDYPAVRTSVFSSERARKGRQSSLSIFICLIFLALSCSAAERFQLIVQNYETQEDGQITRHLLLTDTNQFVFMPPTIDWEIRAGAAEKTVTFVSPDRALTIMMQIAPTNSALQPKLELEQLREQAIARYPSAKVLEEFLCYTGSGPGQTFDLGWQTGKNSFITRLAFIGFNGGTIEFSMSTPVAQFKESQIPFTRILTSFRVETLAVKK
jgi:hypothetical protein